MAERFELGFRRASDGRVSLLLDLLPSDPGNFSNDTTPRERSPTEPKFRRTSAQIIAFIHRLCAAADADDATFFSEAQGEMEFLQKMGRFMTDSEHETSREDGYDASSMDASPRLRQGEGQNSGASATTTKVERPTRKSSSASQGSMKPPMLKILPLKLNPTKSRTATPTSLRQRDHPLHQASDSMDDTSGDSSKTSAKATPGSAAKIARSLARKNSNSSLAFRFNEDGDIVTQVSQFHPPSQPRTPTEEIIVPVLRKSHVKLDNRIIIEVGDREFHVCSDIFEESVWFTKAIRRATFSSESPRVRIENDPELFGEVLRYLRTGMFPLYWDRTNGFDVGRYADLENQARMYKLPVLLQWIEERQYLNVVTTEVVMRETRIRKGAEHYQRHVLLGNENETVDAVIAGVDEVWMCPASIEAHEGDSTLCEVEGCCGDLTRASAKNHPEQRVKVDVLRVFTTQRKWTVNTHHLLRKKIVV
ncbi:hypothetical protein F5X68DRAFT_252618 [Plectosphaerella plurivora]|uniref:BTB domain-containing protein n=1 Tax=Plectosphaerella plurivora TaxID=936078 RepID=A0A9P8VGG4_9PEZI|nr:hypothetical protein F5X68DRAFT_252618 [Plectosphaerella plurivora]